MVNSCRAPPSRSVSVAAASAACSASRPDRTSPQTDRCTSTTPAMNRQRRVAASIVSAASPCLATRSIPPARWCWWTTSRRSTATTTVATSRSALTDSSTSQSAMPDVIRGAIPVRTTRPRISACSTARSCGWWRATVLRRRATRCRASAQTCAGCVAAPQRRRPRHVKRSMPGVCATRTASRSTPTPGRSGSSSTTSARTLAKR